MTEIEIFFAIAKENGIVWTLVVAILFGIWKYLDRIIKRKIDGLNVETNLLSHPLFSELHSNITYKIDLMKMDSLGRQKIFNRFLKIKFKTFDEEIRKFVVLPGLDKLSSTELEAKIKENLYSTIKKYEDRCHTAGIPMFVIEKFNVWHKEHVALVGHLVETSCSNPFYYTNTEKMANVLDAYKIGFSLTISDAAITLKDLNGTLSKWLEDNQETINKW